MSRVHVLNVSRDSARDMLDALIEQGQTIRDGRWNDAATDGTWTLHDVVSVWYDRCCECLRQMFIDPHIRNRFENGSRIEQPNWIRPNVKDRRYTLEHVGLILRELDSIIGRIDLFPELEPEATKSTKLDCSKVFIVHGHDQTARESVARFIEKLGIEAVILAEQPNRGQTLIEKLEAHSKPGFAVVLLTPDDVGASRADRDNLRPRARQNVILELGMFLVALGRDRVCPLLKGDIEIPSDYAGVVWTQMDDAGAWRLALAKELWAAGYAVDLGDLG